MHDLAGEADIAGLAALIANDARARILAALLDGRALPASVLASEAGVTPSTASEHLQKLVVAGLVTVRPQGRHRYFSLGGAETAELLEVLSRLAPRLPVRSLREGTRAQALRDARTCYDHLAGRLGVGLFQALLESGAVDGGDGVHRPDEVRCDRLAARGRDIDYRLTTAGRKLLLSIGVSLHAPGNGVTPVRYCIDWSEQRHHLSGAVGRELTARLFEVGWVERLPQPRAVRVTTEGLRELPSVFGASVLDRAAGLARGAEDVARPVAS